MSFIQLLKFKITVILTLLFHAPYSGIVTFILDGSHPHTSPGLLQLSPNCSFHFSSCCHVVSDGPKSSPSNYFRIRSRQELTTHNLVGPLPLWATSVPIIISPTHSASSAMNFMVNCLFQMVASDYCLLIFPPLCNLPFSEDLVTCF